MPLSEEARLTADSCEALRTATLVIVESRSVAMRYLKQAGNTHAEVFCLDNQREMDRKDLDNRLQKARSERENVALISDVGMPILFDPGKWVLDRARELGFEIHCVPGPTSWGTAAALSGFSPPFLVVGFLPREKNERLSMLKKLATSPASCVFMETPYRFKLFIEHFKMTFGAKREVFLAWEIGNEGECLLWGSVREIETECARRGLEKGEFVWISTA
jgi:16S rRNA (cytidine1402-2'-O)-methyltransferase